MRLRNVMIALAMVLMTACAAQQAREQVLLPAMEQAWVGVKADIEAGIDILELQNQKDGAARARADLAEFDDVFKTGDIERLPKTKWPQLANLANQGIAMRVVLGEIGAGVAKSKVERLRLFHNAIVEVLR